MEYNFRDIEKKWQQKWIDDGVYKVPNDSSKPKYYVLDMFPYPSGSGLHVGHPLGYIASDIYARYKRLKGFNVLHPMGYDAFGLPAEQYAIEHGVHPAVSTAKNIATFRSQLDKIGFCFDWSREVNTSDPKYYKWTQWIFLQLFKSWYNRKNNRTEHINTLIKIFEEEGNINYPIPNANFQLAVGSWRLAAGNEFSAKEWKSFDEKTRQTILMEYRIAYCGYGEVNWCEALGTVLANDEVVNGVSERGGHPVVKKKLRQWYLRITEYADRLLEGLQKVDFSDAMKEMQSNWIGKSSGAEIDFRIEAPSRPSPSGKESQHTEPRHHTADPSLYSITKELAERKRKEPTFEEELLWQHLRGNQTGFHIRRQHIISSYIVDFACIDKMVTIEIDGGYHNDPLIREYDAARTKYLEERGFKEIRFTNEQVRTDINSVIEEIKKQLSGRASSRKVSPEGGDLEGAILRVYTTRPDTIFGVDFMVVAPEHELVEKITTPTQKQAVENYIAYVKARSERERMAEKKISGVFTGAHALNPFDNKKIPVWISEYVLAGYGTGAIMAVPSGDERDHKFAKYFNLPITNIIGDAYNGEEANPTKDAVLSNSGFLNGMVMRDAIEVVINKLEEMKIGKRKVNYKMHDAAFSRQRYWGEPFPIKWIDGIAYPLDENELPLELPHVETYKPGPEGEGPLANMDDWKYQKVKLDLSESSKVSPVGGDLEGALETNTMPGYAGSSWYFLRYMDSHNEKKFCDKKFSDYWSQVDLYVGGTEHAVGHLLYSRMWVKALYDLGFIGFDEPYKKLLNQGMIQGVSEFIYRYNPSQNQHPDSLYMSESIPYSNIDIKDLIAIKGKDVVEIMFNRELPEIYFSFNNIPKGEEDKFSPIHIPIEFVNSSEVDIENLFKSNKKFEKALFRCTGGFFLQGKWFDDNKNEVSKKFIFKSTPAVEKMSKSKLNVVNPDDVVTKYGADTFRMYEMFLGPVEMSKPWDTKGIEGVHRFLKKLWRLFFDEQKGKWITEEKPNNEELKVLHRTIKKIEEDTERFSYNTAVSTFMVCVNELTDLKCHKKEILEPLLILLAPYAPHIAEELYYQLHNDSLSFGEGRGEVETILDAPFPKWEEKYLVETSKEYPISVNGKLRTTINIDLNAAQPQVEKIVLANPVIQKWIEGKQPKKIIYVKGKMVNVVV